MSMQQEETVGNNAVVKLFLAVIVAVVIFLLFGWFSWWSGPSKTVVAPDRGTTVVVPQDNPTVVVPAPSNPPTTGR